MKAIILAGGFGTRLRPLTLHTPKPVVPIFDRPFLNYQIDLLKGVPQIDEIVLSLNYRSDSIESIIGNGSNEGLSINYTTEPSPLGTGGAIKFCAQDVTETFLVLNGDVLTHIDLNAVINLHHTRKARATIVLTPVENPNAYGLVQTDSEKNVINFIEKPDSTDLPCNTINAGIYVMEPETLERIPLNTKYSIERTYFPSLVKNHEPFVAYIDHGYWLDIGTTEKYVQAHRDILRGKYPASLQGQSDFSAPVIHPSATIDPTASLEAPCFIGANVQIGANAHIGANSVIGSSSNIGHDTSVTGSILWPHCSLAASSSVHDAILGHSTHVEEHASIHSGVVLGDQSVITAYSKLTQ
tara:strand:- start:356 stop:1420 length:1065 start_codon:yes stop_codon:yes gene_type:complete